MGTTKLSQLPTATGLNGATDYVIGPQYNSVSASYSDVRYSIGLIATLVPSGTPASFSSVVANTLAPGASATAVLGGTGPSNYTLTFGIPAGTPGTGNVSTSGTPTIGGIPIWVTYASGTGSIGTATATQIRTAAAAAASGANSDITSLGGLTTALSVAQGGTGATAAGATAANNIGAAAKGANSDITSITGLTTALSVAQGGIGATSISSALDTAFGATQGNVLYRGASTWASLGPGTSGQFLKTGGASANPSWGSAGGGGFPSAFSTKSANYTVVSADANTLFTLTGSFTLSLPSASSFGAGNGIFLKKVDGSGVWAVTPASGTIDGLSSINVYQERFALVSDGTNWQSVNRPKGWVPIGTTVVSSAVASVIFTTAFSDTELRDMQFEGNIVAFSAADTLLSMVQKGGSYLSSNYIGSTIVNKSGTVSSSSNTSGWYFNFGSSVSSQSVELTIFQFGNTTSSYTRYSGICSSVPANLFNTATQTSAGAITGFEFISAGGANITGGTFTQKGFRP